MFILSFAFFSDQLARLIRGMVPEEDPKRYLLRHCCGLAASVVQPSYRNEINNPAPKFFHLQILLLVPVHIPAAQIEYSSHLLLLGSGIHNANYSWLLPSRLLLNDRIHKWPQEIQTWDATMLLTSKAPNVQSEYWNLNPEGSMCSTHLPHCPAFS